MVKTKSRPPIYHKSMDPNSPFPILPEHNSKNACQGHQLPGDLDFWRVLRHSYGIDPGDFDRYAVSGIRSATLIAAAKGLVFHAVPAFCAIEIFILFVE